MRLTRTMALAVGSALALSMAACSDDDTTTPNATPTSSSPTPAAFANTLEIKGVDYGYVLSSQSVKSGLTKITFENAGKDAHMVAAFPLKPGKTVGELVAALDTDDEKD